MLARVTSIAQASYRCHRLHHVGRIPPALRRRQREVNAQRRAVQVRGENRLRGCFRSCCSLRTIPRIRPGQATRLVNVGPVFGLFAIRDKDASQCDRGFPWW